MKNKKFWIITSVIFFLLLAGLLTYLGLTGFFSPKEPGFDTDRVTVLVEELDKFKLKVKELEAKDAENTTIIKNTQGELELKINELAQEKEKVTGLQTDLQTVNQKLEEAKNKAEVDQAEIDRLTSELDFVTRRWTTATNKVSELEGQITNLNTRIEALEADKQANLAKIAELQAEIEALKSQIVEEVYVDLSGTNLSTTLNFTAVDQGIIFYSTGRKSDVWLYNYATKETKAIVEAVELSRMVEFDEYLIFPAVIENQYKTLKINKNTFAVSTFNTSFNGDYTGYSTKTNQGFIVFSGSSVVYIDCENEVCSTLYTVTNSIMTPGGDKMVKFENGYLNFGYCSSDSKVLYFDDNDDTITEFDLVASDIQFLNISGTANYISTGAVQVAQGQNLIFRFTANETKKLGCFNSISKELIIVDALEGVNFNRAYLVENGFLLTSSTANTGLYFFDKTSKEVSQVFTTGNDYSFVSGNKGIVAYNKTLSYLLYFDCETKTVEQINMGSRYTVNEIKVENNDIFVVAGSGNLYLHYFNETSKKLVEISFVVAGNWNIEFVSNEFVFVTTQTNSMRCLDKATGSSSLIYISGATGFEETENFIYITTAHFKYSFDKATKEVRVCAYIG